jgi:enterochelin esterase-like enzyme
MRFRGPIVAVVAVVFIAGGLLGAFRYVRDYWLYRGFDPPRDPAYVVVRTDSRRTLVPVHRGQLIRTSVASPALGGAHQLVLVYLPPGYRPRSDRRYPTLYLLHGFPGGALNFPFVGAVCMREDVLVAERRLRPLILVMPQGSHWFFGDAEWVDGVHPHNGWDTFVARDVVRAIDRRFHTIPRGWARGLAGLSAGGYGAINIALHHPGEFGLVESWSGYMRALRIGSVFGNDPERLAANSPIDELAAVAPSLRRAHTYVWFYVGAKDHARAENAAFASELTRFGIPHRVFVVTGPHNWRLWRREMPAALIVASRHLRRTDRREAPAHG